MNLLLLPGNGKRSGEWLKQVESTLKPLFNQTFSQAYAHWDKDEPEIDLDLEIKRLPEAVRELGPYSVFQSPPAVF